MMRIGRNSGVEYTRQQRKLSAKSVASAVLVSWPHALEIPHEKSSLRTSTVNKPS